MEEMKWQDAVDPDIACNQSFEILYLFSWSSLQKAEPKSLGEHAFWKYQQKNQW